MITGINRTIHLCECLDVDNELIMRIDYWKGSVVDTLNKQMAEDIIEHLTKVFEIDRSK